MAKKSQTPEEKLAAALVPEEDWPYELPENWCWVRLIDGFAECLDEYRKPINAKERASRVGDVPYYGATQQVGWIDDFLTNEQLVLVGEDGAPFLDLLKNKAYIIEGKAWVNNHAHILRSLYGTSGNIFLMHYLNIFDFTDFVNGTTRLKLTQASLRQIPIPLPPKKEIQRLVAIIEKEYSKLDAAKSKVESALAATATRKAAILHAAFTGELTGTWRQEHDIDLQDWLTVPLGEVCTINPRKVDVKSLSDDLEVSFFPMSSLDAKLGAITEPETRPLGKVKKGFTNFKEGDVVLAKITPCFENGKAAVIGKLVNDLGYGTTEFFVLRCSDKIVNKYLFYILRDPVFRAVAKNEMAGAVGQQRLPKIYLDEYKVQLPNTIAEQREIVRILDTVLAREQRVTAAAEKILADIDLMKKSVLARAFRGELGTGDPSDVSAVTELREYFSRETAK